MLVHIDESLATLTPFGSRQVAGASEPPPDVGCAIGMSGGACQFIRGHTPALNRAASMPDVRRARPLLVRL
jgi:hypothetical protein